MTIHSRTATLISTLLLGSLQAFSQTPNIVPLQQAAAFGDDLFLRSGSTGMVLVIVRNREVYFRGFGETAPGSHQTPTPDSLLRLCSLTKIFTTDLLTKLMLDQTLRLDTPLQTLAPPHVRVPLRDGHSDRPITLADLATHTSGLPREVGPAPRSTPHFTFPDYRFRWRWLPAAHLLSTPGTAALYSNVGFDLLGDALEAAAHKPYAALLYERTTGPLHLTQTGFTPTSDQCLHLLASAHDQGPCTDTQNSAGSSGLYSSAADMAIWLKYLLGTEAPAIPAQNPAAQAVYLPLPGTLSSAKGLDHAGVPTGIGLGWLHLLAPGDPSEIVEKTGGGAGFATYIALNQTRHIGLFLAATEGPAYRFNLFKAANDLLLTLAGLPPRAPEPPPPSRSSTHGAGRKHEPRSKNPPLQKNQRRANR